LADPVVIAHGRFQRGNSARRWSAVEAALRRSFGNGVEIRFTGGPGDATILARNAVNGGARWIMAAGGDGTVHEVVNGLFDGARRLSSSAVLSIIPCGSANDFARSLGIGRGWTAAISEPAKLRDRSVDAGLARYRDWSGEMREEVFLNVVDCGVGAEAVRRLQRLPRSRASYLAAALASVVSFAPRPLRISLNGADARETPPSLGILLANGRFFGAGIPCTPMADVADGQLDVLVLGPFGRLEVIRKIHLLLSGRHLTEPKVTHHLAGSAKVESPEPTLFEMDGELRGKLPVEVHVVPQALRIRS